jgi:hypothetical protein
MAPFVLVSFDGVFGRLKIAALCGYHTLNVCLFGLLSPACLWAGKGWAFYTDACLPMFLCVMHILCL